jgi:hypothetical protein
MESAQQVVSSAIGNEPPPAAVITVLETSSMASTAMGVRPVVVVGSSFHHLNVCSKFISSNQAV